MCAQKRAWFDQKAKVLDPALRWRLQSVRSKTYAAQPDTIPVIVKLKRDQDEKKAQELKKLCQNESCNHWDGELRFLNGFYGRFHPDTIRALSDHGSIARIYYDREVKAFLDVASKTTGARDAQLQLGLSGKGITIRRYWNPSSPGSHPTGQPHHRFCGFGWRERRSI